MEQKEKEIYSEEMEKLAMSHRKGMPKPSARERTKYRWRIRHEIETPEDTKRLGIYDKVKERLFGPKDEDKKEHIV